MGNENKKPLWRKENKTIICKKYYVQRGEDFRHDRNTKKMKNFEGGKISMKKRKLGRDYTPLYKFLLSKVGKNWDEIFSEAKSRLDEEKPIWHLVMDPNDEIVKTRYFGKLPERIRCGESSYYSALFVDENNILQKVNPNAKAPEPNCSCCTWTFNGKVINSNPKNK